MTMVMKVRTRSTMDSLKTSTLRALVSMTYKYINSWYFKTLDSDKNWKHNKV